MIYINTNGKLLPIKELNAIGIEGGRGDAPTSELSAAFFYEFAKNYNYNTVWCFSTYLQDDKTAAYHAKIAFSSGIKLFEIANEPEERIAPKILADRWKRIKDAVPNAKVIGPSTGKFLPEYVDEFINAGAKPDLISWNGYMDKLIHIPNRYLECQMRWGIPGMITELAFSPLPEWGKTYPVQLNNNVGFHLAKGLFENLNWTFYNGPKPVNDPRKEVGLFDWNGKKWVANENYNSLLAIGK